MRTAFPRMARRFIGQQISWRGLVIVQVIHFPMGHSRLHLSQTYRMSSTHRNSQPGTGASVPVEKRVPVRLAYSTEAPLHGPVGKRVLILVHVMDARVLPRFLLILLRPRRPPPKMAAYRSSSSH
jgi:hypothetical protein